MNEVCKVCGAPLGGDAKFCRDCAPQPVVARPSEKTGEGAGLMADPAAGGEAFAAPAKDARREKRARHVLLSKPAQTIYFLLLIASLPLFIPGLARYREMLPDPHDLVSFKNDSGTTGDLPGAGPQTAETTSSATGADAPVIVGSDHPIEDPAKALDSFYAALARTEAKQPGAVTRVTHYGDSPITNDGITSTVRRQFQTHFGDAGHGFILIDKPWAWYGHDAITFTSGGDWSDNPMMGGQERDGEYGLGGVAFHASGPGRFVRYAPASQGETGKNFAHMEVYYEKQPGGGQFSVSVNNGNAQTVSTDGDGNSGFYEIKAPQNGPNSFEIKSVSGSVRLFGAVLENDGPGVVYDSLGVNGAYAGLLATEMNENHWREQLQHRNPNLVIINYGTNESQYAKPEQMERYEKDLREVVRRVRAALPQVAILIVSPMDRGEHAPGGRIITKPSIPLIVEMQQRVARETGCAFFDTFHAMGGEGTMAKWHDGPKHMVGADLTHPTAEGAEIVGRLIYEALNDGYAKYKARAGMNQQMVAQTKKD